MSENVSSVVVNEQALIIASIVVVLISFLVGIKVFSQEKHSKSVPVTSTSAGIAAVQVYFPSSYVNLKELAKSSGRESQVTQASDEECVSFCGDNEDNVSMSLTAVHQLLECHSITPQQIGRLEVYSKDAEKCVSALLEHILDGNVEAVATTESSLRGAGALINSLQWVESDYSKGKYALVVAAADSTVHFEGNGSCGSAAVAFLLSRNASLSIDQTTKVVNRHGVLTQDDESGILKSLEKTFHRFSDKRSNQETIVPSDNMWVLQSASSSFSATCLGRLVLLGVKRNPMAFTPKKDDPLSQCISKCLTSKTLETFDPELRACTRKMFKSIMAPGCLLSNNLGCGDLSSLLGIASVFEHFLHPKNAQPPQPSFINVFVSGSYSSSIFQMKHERRSSFEVRPNLNGRLSGRSKRSVTEYLLAVQAKKHWKEMEASSSRGNREEVARLKPCFEEDRVLGGAYVLIGIDAQGNRLYHRRPASSTVSFSTIPKVPMSPKTSIEKSTIPKEASLPVMRNKVGEVVVTGVSAGLPCVKQADGNFSREAFDALNLDRLILGENMIDNLTEKQLAGLVEKNVVMTGRNKDGTAYRRVQASPEDCVKIASMLPQVDLTNYGVDPRLAATMDSAAMAAVAAGLEALKAAGLVSGKSKEAADWCLPEHLRDRTAVFYASSFPGLDAAVSELTRYGESLKPSGCSVGKLLREVRRRSEHLHSKQMPQAVEEALNTLEADLSNTSNPAPFEFDRKFLFKVLCLGNAQLAQVCKARGPNSQTNAACAGTTQAVAMTMDLLESGKCDRVVVVAGDNATSSSLLPWLANGFRALGAASTCGSVCDAALPFDKRRNGMILGAGAVGLVFETTASLEERNKQALSLQLPIIKPKCRLIAAQFSNSAYHGAALDRKHIGSELKRFLSEVEMNHGITLEMVAKHGVFLSHETCTHASPSSSCAANEVGALRDVFGDELLTELTLINTKGYTGHAMGVSFEDVTAVEILHRQMVPPMPNNAVADPYLGCIKLSPGGDYAVKYALRFSAGFGSHVCFALYGTVA